MPIGLLGAGAQAREIAEWATPESVAFRAVEADFVQTGLVAVTTPSATERGTPVVAAVGPPALRRRLVAAWPGTAYATVIASTAAVSATARVGAGSSIGPGAVLSTAADVGEHVVVNIGATVSHDVRLGDFVTLAPGAHVGGGALIGAGAWIGIGATVADGVRIADGVVVGAGAVVVADVDVPNQVVVGVPARPLRVNDGWLARL